jgi:hypothetical protein
MQVKCVGKGLKNKNKNSCMEKYLLYWGCNLAIQ